eukprot:TRINITY_DN120621_c2_g1_i1.p2 TRINITY_DN120621_c2_g1~~TRINITY_DN120621_c2_g1_i1.p2  ORF type:complete len:392 (-),score=20.85 TRINITY_DN120621_c2_g1_i1:3666-4841(-)
MSNSELTRYMLECIFDVWFKVFTDSIRLYPKLNHIDFIRYAYNLLNLIKKKVLFASKNKNQYKPLKNLELLYKRMIEACGMCEQKEEAARIFQDIKKDSIEPSVDTFNAYFQACGKALHNVGKKTGGVEAKMTVEEEKKAAAAMEKEKKQQEKLLRIIHKVVIELSNRCPNPECDRYLREEEIITAWPRSLHTYSIKCPACGKEFIPDLSVQFSPEKEKHYYFLFPPLFAKEVHNLIENKSSNIFFKVSCNEVTITLARLLQASQGDLLEHGLLLPTYQPALLHVGLKLQKENYGHIKDNQKTAFSPFEASRHEGSARTRQETCYRGSHFLQCVKCQNGRRGQLGRTERTWQIQKRQQSQGRLVDSIRRGTRETTRKHRQLSRGKILRPLV